MAPTTRLPHVVVIGCGFGGLEAVRGLSRSGAVEVTLVDRTNHHLFQPLLYQVATAGLSAPAISAPIRHLLRREMQGRRLTVLQAHVATIDVAAAEVVFDRGTRLHYDHLIVAAGATHSYFGNDTWAPFAPGLKTLADAFDIRARLIGAFERAERAQSVGDDAERAACMSFVVIGAGPTGVELAGTLVEIARHTLPDEFRHIDSRQARVLLVEGADRVLGAFDPRLSASARRQLEKLGVEVLTGCRVTGIDADGVQLQTANGTTQLQSRTVLWAAGVAASPLGQALARAAGVVLDRAGRLPVLADLSLAGHPNISVIGDLAAASDSKTGKPVPGVSPAAKQMGRRAAANILARLKGEPTRGFVYADYGTLATIGRNAAVVQIEVPLLGQLRFAGYAAWLFWLFAHIYFLIGFRNRLVVLIDWAWSYLSFARHARVVAEPARAADQHPAPGGARQT